MKLLVDAADARIELRALTGRRMDKLCELAAAIVAAIPDEETTPKPGFGFQTTED